MSLLVQMSAIFSVFISLLIGGMILLIGINMTQEVTQIVLSDNEQISIARAYELGEMMDKLKWQLKIMSSRNVLSEGDPAVVEATMKDQKKYLSPEVVGAFYAWNSGDYVSSEGAKEMSRTGITLRKFLSPECRKLSEKQLSPNR